MGIVKAIIRIENRKDRILAESGQIPFEQIRKTEIEGLVSTGTTGLSLSVSIIKKLGLEKSGEREIKTANGTVVRRLYLNARITILDRFCQPVITELPDDCPPLIGVTILKELDLVPNTTNETLEPNPAHGGKWTSYAY